MSISRGCIEHFKSVAGTTCSVFNNALHGVFRESYFWNRYPLPLWRRLDAYRHGFLSRAYNYCSLHENDPTDYLSDLAQYRYVRPAVNPDYMDVFRNKVAFHMATESHVEGIPRFFGVVESGSWIPYESTEDDLRSLLQSLEIAILKPVTGVHGDGVYRIGHNGDHYTVNGTPFSDDEFDEFLSGVEDSLVTEFVQQHPYAQKIWPDSTNSIRILTIKDPLDDTFFIARAIHRFGGSSSGPIDNWSSGGFAAPIDIETGRMIDLLSYSREDGMEHWDAHPGTETPVVDQNVPEWERIRSFVLEVADLHRQNPYVGWDVVLTEEGPVLLEGNCAPGHALFQLHEGLLEDERISRFFESL